MSNEKTRAAEMAAEQAGESRPHSDGGLLFDVELSGLREAETLIDRLQEKYQALGTASGADQILLAHMSAMLERSRLAPAGDLPDLTGAMIQTWEALVSVE